MKGILRAGVPFQAQEGAYPKACCSCTWTKAAAASIGRGKPQGRRLKVSCKRAKSWYWVFRSGGEACLNLLAAHKS